MGLLYRFALKKSPDWYCPTMLLLFLSNISKLRATAMRFAALHKDDIIPLTQTKTHICPICGTTFPPRGQAFFSSAQSPLALLYRSHAQKLEHHNIKCMLLIQMILSQTILRYNLTRNMPVVNSSVASRFVGESVFSSDMHPSGAPRRQRHSPPSHSLSKKTKDAKAECYR